MEMVLCWFFEQQFRISYYPFVPQQAVFWLSIFLTVSASPTAIGFKLYPHHTNAINVNRRVCRCLDVVNHYYYNYIREGCQQRSRHSIISSVYVNSNLNSYFKDKVQGEDTGIFDFTVPSTLYSRLTTIMTMRWSLS